MKKPEPEFVPSHRDSSRDPYGVYPFIVTEGLKGATDE